MQHRKAFCLNLFSKISKNLKKISHPYTNMWPFQGQTAGVLSVHKEIQMATHSVQPPSPTLKAEWESCSDAWRLCWWPGVCSSQFPLDQSPGERRWWCSRSLLFTSALINYIVVHNQCSAHTDISNQWNKTFWMEDHHTLSSMFTHLKCRFSLSIEWHNKKGKGIGTGFWSKIGYDERGFRPQSTTQREERADGSKHRTSYASKTFRFIYL